MKRIMTSLFILSLVLLTACFGGKGDNAKEVTYDGQIAKLQKDIIEYQNSTKRAGEKEFKMYGEGIYVNILAEDNIEGYEGWYFYSLDVVVATEGDQMKELVKLVSVAGPKGRVYTVFGDNYVGLFEYKGIADTKTNGQAFETVLKEDQKIGEVTEDGEIKDVKAGEIVPAADKKASVTSKLAYDVTKSAITFKYKDNLVTTAVVTIKDGEKVITTNAAITAKAGNATIAAITLPGTIGKETVYTLSSKDIIFGDNNEVTVAPKDYPVIEKAESVDTRTVKLTLKDAYTIEELTKQAITIKNTKEGSTEAAIELVVSAVKDKEVTVKTTTAAAVLVDAATYEVTSEFFVGEDITFVAKVAAAKYTVVKQTQVAIAEQTVFYFGLVNQYGEKVEVKSGVTLPTSIKVEQNGIVRQTLNSNAIEADLGFLKLTTSLEANKDDEIRITFTGDSYIKSIIEYVVEDPEDPVNGKVTRSEDITLTPDKVAVAAGESIKFTAVGLDIYGAPVPLTAESNIIWTIDGTTISEAEGTLSDNTLEYTFNTPGTYEIRVSWKDDTKIKQSLTVNVGMSKLSEVKIENIKSIDKDGKVTTGAGIITPIYSKNGKVPVLNVTANSEAALLALDELAITVKEATNEIVAADLGITKELSKDGKSVIVSIAPTKVGKFKLKVVATRDDVEVEETSDEITTTQVTTVAAITLATKATDDVASVAVKAGDTLSLKKGKKLELEMVLFNKHGEEITEDKLVDADNFSILSKTHKVEASELVIANPVVHKTITSGAIINTISITTIIEQNAEFEVKFTKDDFEFKFNVDTYLPKVTSIDTIGDIVAAKALVADDGVKYHVVKFLDQDGEKIKVTKAELAAVKVVNKDGEEKTGITVKYAQGDALTTAAVWLDKDTAETEATDAAVTGINIAASGVEAGEYTVTIGLTGDNKDIKQSFKVNVGAARVVDSIKMLTDEKVINLAEDATATIQFELLDQYGKRVDASVTTNLTVKFGETDLNCITSVNDQFVVSNSVFSINLKGGVNVKADEGKHGNLVVKYETAVPKILVTSAAIKVNYVAESDINSIDILAKTTVNSNATTISALDIINAAAEVDLTATAYDKDGKEIKWDTGKQPAHLKWEVVEAKDADGGSMNLSKFSFENGTTLAAKLKLVSEPNYTVKVKVSVTDGKTTPTVYASKEITLNVDNNGNLLADKVVIGGVAETDGSINALVVEKDGVKSIEVEAGKKFKLVLNSEDKFGNVKPITMKKAGDDVVAKAEELVVKEIVKDKYIVSADTETNSLEIQTNGNLVGTSTLKVTFLDANGTEVEKTFSIEVLEKVEAYAKANTAKVTNSNISVIENGDPVAVAVEAKDQFGNDITTVEFVDAIEIYNDGITADGKGKAAAVEAIGDNHFAVVKVVPTTENKYTVAVDGTDIKVTGGGSANEQEDCKITILDKNGDTFELVFEVTVTVTD